MKSINRKSPKYFSPAQERRKERRQGYPLLKIYVPSESQMMATAPTNAAASPDPISPTELDENARALHEYLILKGKHLDRVENNFKDQSLRCRADLKQFQEIFRDKGERIFGDMDLLLEDLSARHRNRFQVLQLQLNRLHPLLNTLRAPPGLGMAGPKNSELNDQLNKIRESADAIFDEAQDSAALEEIKLVVSDHWETFFRLDNKKFFRFSCLPQARELKLRPLPDKGGRNVIWFEVSWVQNPNSQVREVKKLSKFLLDDLQVVIKLDDPNGTTSQVHNLKELHDQRGVHFKDLHRAVEFKIDLEEFRGDVQFEVRLRKEHILHSPTILSLRQNESFRENVKLPDIKMDATLDANGNEILDCSSAKLWNNMSALDRNGNNATRSNQNNGDLDESDLR